MQDLQQLREWTGKISSIASGYKLSQLLYTAFDAGVFDLLEVPKTAKEIATAMHWSERGSRMLLDGLVALELAIQTDNTYSNTKIAAACLAKNGCAYQGHILRHNHNSWNDWMRLADRVRTGTCEPKGEDRTGAPLRDFILGMRDIATMSAREVLHALDFRNYTHILDLACGPGTYAITFLQENPHIKATLFDKPEVIEIAREEVVRTGLAERIDYIGGDCITDDLGSDYDLVFMSNIIHSFSAEENAALVKRAYDALLPGGAILIKDFIMKNDRSGPAFGLIFALHMLVHTPGGNTYTHEEIKGWTDKAGFLAGRLISLTPQTRIWLVQKP